MSRSTARMLGDHVRQAFRDLRRRPLVSLAVVLGLGVGVGVAAVLFAIHHAVTRDPAPGRSDITWHARIDHWPTEGTTPPLIERHRAFLLSYRDTDALLRLDVPMRRTATFSAHAVVTRPGERPASVIARYCTAHFFALVGMSFRAGGPWPVEADAAPDPWVVLSDELARERFGDADAVGQAFEVEGRPFRIAGVLERYRPSVRFYEASDIFGQYGLEGVYLPFAQIAALDARPRFLPLAWTPYGDTSASLRASEAQWFDFWVELRTPDERTAFERAVAAYIAGEHTRGRLTTTDVVKLADVRAWTRHFPMTPDEIWFLLVIGFVFLIGSALNVTSLLLSSFLGHAGEVGVRRALGATRLDVFVQHIVESQVVAVGAALVGVPLAAVLLWFVNQRLPDMNDAFQVDGTIAFVALGLALLAGAVAGLYPSWRVCSVNPAAQMKVG